ncbi:MAG: 30S ribosomal protein S1, partial [Thermoguttaceae bacterium]
LNERLDEPAPLPSLPTDIIPSVEAGHFPMPNIRDRLTSEMEAEFAMAFGDSSMEELLGADGASAAEQLETGTKCSARIVAVHKDDVFVDLGRREQGVISLQQFVEHPAVGGMIDVVVEKFSPEDGLYELRLPHSAVHVEDWSDLIEGALVEARITGNNNGGLECEVNHIRGFIPISQVSLYRVDDLGEYVGQSFFCVVNEADPQRRNLVLSRRAVLERERHEAREKLLESLRPGQIHDGVVRKLMDFGAFVDIGGVEGLLHVSQLAWGRVKHPSDVLSEGQKIRVRIDKVDQNTGKISLAYRDLLENPWDRAAEKYGPNSVVRGTVTKLMDFGAFVELEPGIEGLIHISQLSNKHVHRPGEVVSVGQDLD